ncbi:MAG: hypothetical protein IPH18_09980 [Chitinophagaceae bacterium]|nr:hypothetical protein [Chitinophagaceae bacterium]
MTDYEIIEYQKESARNRPSLMPANIQEDVSEERIKCTDFEGFIPIG